MASPTGLQLSVEGTGGGWRPGLGTGARWVGLAEDGRHLTHDRPLGEWSKA